MARWSKREHNDYLISKGKATSQMSANALTKHVIDYMNANGYYVWRNNTMGVFDPSQAVKKLGKYITAIIVGKSKPNQEDLFAILKSCYRKHHGKKGVSDVIGIRQLDGKFVSVEIKVGDDILSPFQISFNQDIKKCNGINIIARTFESFKADLKKLDK